MPQLPYENICAYSELLGDSLVMQNFYKNFNNFENTYNVTFCLHLKPFKHVVIHDAGLLSEYRSGAYKIKICLKCATAFSINYLNVLLIKLFKQTFLFLSTCPVSANTLKTNIITHKGNTVDNASNKISKQSDSFKLHF